MIKLQCQTCLQAIQYNLADVLFDHISHWYYVSCISCGNSIQLGMDIIVEDTSNPRIGNSTQNSQVFEDGDSVVITNREHPWHKEIALVCGRNHGHLRLELHGIRIWMPTHWVAHEPSST